MYSQLSGRYFIISILVMFFSHHINFPLKAMKFHDDYVPAPVVVSRSSPMTPFDEALAITKSRLSFYKVRQALLEGEDEVSRAYQKEITAENNVNITCDGGGLDLVMAMLSAPEKYAEHMILQSQKDNRTFIFQWQYVKTTILTLKNKWNNNVFQDFQNNRNFFAIKDKVNESTEGFNIHPDIYHIASDVKDFDEIQSLLMMTEPYLNRQKTIKVAEEAAEEKQRQKMATQLWATKSADEIAAWIDGKEKTPKKNRKGKKRKNIKKKTSVLNNESVEKEIKVTIPEITTAELSKSKQNLANIQAGEESTVESKMTETLQHADIIHENISDSEKLPSVTETTVLINDPDPEPVRQQNKEKNLIIKFENEKSFSNVKSLKTLQPTRPRNSEKSIRETLLEENASSNGQSLHTLRLDTKYITTLKLVLSAASHPPVWKEAVKAVCEIIKQWGGSYREDLGKGSAAEFWIGNTRFIVDKTHNSNGLMYRAQMKFMSKGLQRAGITLELLNTL